MAGDAERIEAQVDDAIDRTAQRVAHEAVRLPNLLLCAAAVAAILSRYSSWLNTCTLCIPASHADAGCICFSSGSWDLWSHSLQLPLAFLCQTLLFVVQVDRGAQLSDAINTGAAQAASQADVYADKAGDAVKQQAKTVGAWHVKWSTVTCQATGSATRRFCIQGQSRVHSQHALHSRGEIATPRKW